MHTIATASVTVHPLWVLTSGQLKLLQKRGACAVCVHAPVAASIRRHMALGVFNGGLSENQK